MSLHLFIYLLGYLLIYPFIDFYYCTICGHYKSKNSKIYCFFLLFVVLTNWKVVHRPCLNDVGYLLISFTLHIFINIMLTSFLFILFSGGNYKTGVAFGDCVQYGCDVAVEVTKFLTSQDTPENSLETDSIAQKEVEMTKELESQSMSS